MITNRILFGAAVLLLLLAACVTPPDPQVESSMRISFLTREGCANTPVLRERLDAALEAMGLKTGVATIDVASLDADDKLTGFGTPTILVDGAELFGAPMPFPATPT